MNIQHFAALAAFLKNRRRDCPFEEMRQEGENNLNPVRAKLDLALEVAIAGMFLSGKEQTELFGGRNDFSSFFTFQNGWEGETENALSYGCMMPHTNWSGVGPGDGFSYDLYSIFYNEIGCAPHPWLMAAEGAKYLSEAACPDDAIREFWASGKLPELESCLEDELREEAEDIEADRRRAFFGMFYLYHVGYGDLPEDLLAAVLPEIDDVYFDSVIDFLSSVFGWQGEMVKDGSLAERMFFRMVMDALDGFGFPYIASYCSQEMALYLQRDRALLDETDRGVLDDLFEAITLVQPEEVREGVGIFTSDAYHNGLCRLEGNEWQQFSAIPDDTCIPTVARCACAVFHGIYSQVSENLIQKKKVASAT